MKNFNEVYEEIYKKSYNIIEEKRKTEKIKKILIFIFIIGIGIIIPNIESLAVRILLESIFMYTVYMCALITKRVIVIVIFLLMLGMLLLLDNVLPHNYWHAIFDSICMSVFLGSIYILKPSKNTLFNAYYKKYVINTLIEKYDTNLEYRHNIGISANIYKMGEFENFDRYYAEDYIYGTLNNKINVVMSEVKTTTRGRTEKYANHYFSWAIC